MRLLVIIPAYKEEEAILGTLQSLADLPGKFDVLVVNDGSDDATAERVDGYAADHPNVHLVNLPFNCGIGVAMQTGFQFAEQHGFDYAIQFDGDGQHPADQVMDLVNFAAAEDLDLAVGSRFLPDSEEGFQSTAMRRLGIRFFAGLISLLTGEGVSDPTSGFRVYGRRALAVFARTYPEDYPEPEALFWCCRNQLKVKEAPVKMKERQGGQSSIRYFRTIYYMLKVTVAIVIDRLRSKETTHVR